MLDHSYLYVYSTQTLILDLITRLSPLLVAGLNLLTHWFANLLQ